MVAPVIAGAAALGPGIIFVLIAGLAIFIPVLIGGTGVAIKLIALLNTPILNDSIPLWVVFLVLILFMMFLRRSGQSVQLVRT